MLSKHIGINDLTINVIKRQQPSYETIYSLKVGKLEILNTYIETNLVNSFIRSFKSPVGTYIIFVK